MAKYLYMDGVDDWLQTPVNGSSSVILEFSADFQQSIAQWYHGGQGNFRFLRTANGVDSFDNNGRILSAFVDGVQVVENTTFIIHKKRVRVLLNFSTVNVWINYIFARDNTRNYLRGNIYDIKYFSGLNGTGELVAHYDMSTGTVLDQSGNERHATLSGGTWMGEEEPPSGTTHALTSAINNYSDTIANVTVSKNHPLVSTVQSNSSATNVLSLSKRLSSTTQSNSSGLAYLRATKSLLSTVNSVSSTQVSLNVATVEGSEHALSSTISAQSGTSATISANRRLSTTIQSNAQLTGSLAVTTGMALFGVANVSTSTDGELNVSLALNSSIMANAETFTTMLTNRGLTSEIHSQSQMNAILGINKPLTSMIVVQSSTIAHLVGFGEQIIGYIYLNGYRQLDIHLRGKRELNVPLKGKRELEVHLKGSV